MKSHNNKLSELQYEVKTIINSSTPLLDDLTKIIANYSYPPNWEIYLTPDEMNRASQIANTFSDSYHINVGFFYKNFKKNLFRSVTPFQVIDYNIPFMLLSFFVAGPLLTSFPCLGMAFYQTIASKSKEHDWCNDIACQLILFRKLPHTLQVDCIKRCLTKYETLKNRPTIKTQFFIKSLKYYLMISSINRSDEREIHNCMNQIEDYLKDPSNAASKLYQFLIDELRQVPIIQEEQLGAAKPKI